MRIFRRKQQTSKPRWEPQTPKPTDTKKIESSIYLRSDTMQWRATVDFYNKWHVADNPSYNYCFSLDAARTHLGNGWLEIFERSLHDTKDFDSWDDANRWVSSWGDNFKDLIDLKRRMEFEETWEEEIIETATVGRRT